MPTGLAGAQAVCGDANQTDESARIVEAFKALQVKTGECLSILRDALNRKENEMASLRGRRKAIQAYGHFDR
jgi:hypothetical protein